MVYKANNLSLCIDNHVTLKGIISTPKKSRTLTVVESGISKPNGCQVLGPIFLEITTPRVFKTDIREFADFHPSAQWDKLLNNRGSYIIYKYIL